MADTMAAVDTVRVSRCGFETGAWVVCCVDIRRGIGSDGRGLVVCSHIRRQCVLDVVA